MKKLIFLTPILIGGILGLFIIKVKGTSKNSSLQINEEKTTSQVVQASNSIDNSQSIENTLLSSQSLLAKAIEISKEKDVSQNQKIVELINEAINTINQAISQYPHDSRTWAQRARIYQTVKQYMPEAEKVAISDWQRAIKLDPHNTEYCQNLVKIYLNKGEIESAIFYLKKAAESNPADPNLLKQLAEQQVKAGHLPQAKSTYQQILLVLIDQQQKELIQKEIKNLDQLIAKATASSPGMIEKKVISPLEITLPDSPPLLEARHLVSNVIIAAPEEKIETNQSSDLETNALSGSAMIVKGETEIKICNDNLSPYTQVYLTPEGDSQNQVLVVKRKVPYNPETEECSHFMAAIQEPLDHNLSFKWWIIE